MRTGFQVVAGLVATLVIASACGTDAGGTIHASTAAWPRFTGSAVPSGAQLYVSGIDTGGGRTLWLGEGWLVRGHSHSGFFRSTDAGATWNQVLGWDGWAFWHRFYDADHGLVAAAVLDGYAVHPRLLATADGGRHWTATDLPANGPGRFAPPSIDFVDPRDGWLMQGLGGWSGPECGQTREGVALYRTRDGGGTWTELVRVDGPRGEGGLTLDAGKVGLSFRDLSTGYITTSDPTGGDTVFVTHDGGTTWALQDLPFDQGRGLAAVWPVQWTGSQIGLTGVDLGPRPLRPCLLLSPGPPTPVLETPGPRDAEAPVETVTPIWSTMLLATVDGGATWSRPHPDPDWGSLTSYGAADAMDWMVVSEGSVWTTHDAGRTWAVFDSVLKAGCGFALLRVVDSDRAFASALCGEPGPEIKGCSYSGSDYISQWDCPPLAAPLLATADGGRTWREVAKPAFS